MNDKKNTGKENSGDRNSGDRNSGDWNSGYWNSGDWNSGDWNSGYWNSGYRNSGDRNSGYRNSGYRNSGDWNSGDWNSGDWNSGDGNSGMFNTNEPNIRLFNKDTNLKRLDIKLPNFDFKLTEWISEDKMTDEQKKKDPNFHVKQGTLITRSYKEAWALYWSEASVEDKKMFLALPNFDAEIFEEITGLKVGVRLEVPTCTGKVVEIDGKRYRLEEV